MATRGVKKGSVQSPWTEAEWQILQEHLATAQPRTPVAYLQALLPGRSVTNIHNGLNRVRYKLQNKCPCGSPSPDGKHCPKCLQAIRDRRSARLKQGTCALCGQPLGPGSSSTLCPEHRQRRQSYRHQDLTRHKAKRQTLRKTDPLACHRIIPWPACGHAHWVAQVAAATGRPIIDLCGGTGEQLRLVQAYGGKAYAYYDADETMTALVTYAVATSTLVERPPWPHLLYPCAENSWTQRERLRRLRVLGHTLHAAHLKHIACQDALVTLQETIHPTNAIFLADPPWPGTHHPATHTIDHAQLIEALMDLPQGQDFILSLGAEREALILASKHMGQGCNLYWRTSGPYSVRSILAISPALALHLEQTSGLPGQPIDPEAYGA